MATNKGKKFETLFSADWSETVPDSMCYRLYDVTGGFKGVAHAADFITFHKPHAFMIDCKSCQGNTIPFSDIRQYDKMLEYKDVPGLHVGIVWWSIDNDKIIWVPIETLEKLKKDGKKSYNIKYLGGDEYESLEIPSTKLRTYMTSNYMALVRYYEEKEC